MRGNWIRVLVLPLLLAAGLGACASNAVQPGIVYSSGAPSGGAYGGGPYGSGGNSGGPYGGATRVSGPGQPGSVQQASAPANYPAQGSYGGTGDARRVVSIPGVGLARAGRGGGGKRAGLGGLPGARARGPVRGSTSHTPGA